ncbi:MAG: hypothetical protein DMG41_05240 [Acidobacteria bacterium]|nr:MAG: hypothetical protein DMG42_09340 [Acidobacteriota bacterium]PYT90418.1 MAG: hypothetical protein DMG41_05240 [Acidobacteriota bacterium]
MVLQSVAMVFLFISHFPHLSNPLSTGPSLDGQGNKRSRTVKFATVDGVSNTVKRSRTLAEWQCGF